ncbi:MAG: redoxin domain-containing protein [Actinobacteria bacterium]|nr:redoxin domain-containing protein [Actinomycetota bacterium]MBU1494918.1 redoxin domain-containing protein [Actinomycetota bacterium]MBU1866595.1 redoxin domain-containing protein [Actinomycetota bacterium]
MTLRRRWRILLAALAIGAAACSSASVPIEGIPPLEATTPAAIRALLAESQQPVVLNVWASWCTPCRSEAPLLRDAAAQAAGKVRFVGIDVRDQQDGARRFIAEFGLDGFEHYFDETGAVPADLGGVGVPLTFFFAPGGELIAAHRGVIDERTLALQIDELLRIEG